MSSCSRCCAPFQRQNSFEGERKLQSALFQSKKELYKSLLPQHTDDRRLILSHDRYPNVTLIDIKLSAACSRIGAQMLPLVS